MPAAAIGLRYRERDYWLVAALIAIASAVAWLVLWRFAHSPTLHYLHRALLMGPPMKGSYLLGGFLFIVGWTVMTIAMMLPTSIPLIGIFNRIAHDRPERSLLTALVIVGYLSAWIGFGAFSYAFAIGIHRASLQLTGITERMLIAGTLFLAGAFQFSSMSTIVSPSAVRRLVSSSSTGPAKTTCGRRGGWTASRPLLRRLLLGADAADGRCRRR